VFERVYFELKGFFITRDLLVLKQKRMSLYGRYVSTFFHERKRHTCAMSKNECVQRIAQRLIRHKQTRQGQRCSGFKPRWLRCPDARYTV